MFNNRCQNGATCVSRPNLEIDHFTCICRIGFAGKLCQYKHSDSSGSNVTQQDEIENEGKFNTKLEAPKSKNRCMDETLNPCFDRV